MTGKTRLIISATVITLLALTAYTLFRAGRIEHAYVRGLEGTFKNFCTQFNILESRSSHGSIRADQLNPFIESSGRISPALELAAVVDMNGNVLAVFKNSSLALQNQLYDEILSTLIKENSGSWKSLRVRYFNSIEGKKSGHTKMYLGAFQSSNHRVLAAFSYRLQRRYIVSLVLELALILIIFIILSAILYLVMKRRPAVQSPETGEEKTWAVRNMLRGRDAMTSSGKKDTATDTLNRLVFNLFRELHEKAGPDTVSLYLRQDGEILSKAYELKGKSFLKIDSHGFDTIDLDSDIGQELRSSNPVILEDGHKIMLPLLHAETFMGIIILQRTEPFSSGNIRELRSTLSQSSRDISGCIMVKQVLVDKETGLLSSTGFEVRYDEMLSMHKKDGRAFALILLDPARDEKLTDQQRVMIVRLISTAVREKIPASSFLCLHRNLLAILLPDTVLPVAAETSEKIIKNISRFRIKLEKDRMVNIRPVAGIAATDSVMPGTDIHEQALENLNRARQE